jgi:TM2 domain-containing membrane protein YozV
MFCKNCGAQIPDNSITCQSCGAPTGVAAPPPPVFCRNCGAQNHPASACCANCGAPLYNSAQNVNAKSKMAAGLLAILVGALGVHNFYLGYTGKGVAQLLISVLSVGLLSWVSYVWAVVEGVQIFTGTIATDANGVPLKD